MNDFGRVVASGMVSQYNLEPGQAYGIRNLIHVVAKHLKMQGFISRDENMGPKYTEERNERVSAWLADGSFKSIESITEGMDNAIEGFIGMLRGDNFGKAVLKLGDPEP